MIFAHHHLLLKCTTTKKNIRNKALERILIVFKYLFPAIWVSLTRYERAVIWKINKSLHIVHWVGGDHFFWRFKLVFFRDLWLMTMTSISRENSLMRNSMSDKWNYQQRKREKEEKQFSLNEAYRSLSSFWIWWSFQTIHLENVNVQQRSKRRSSRHHDKSHFSLLSSSQRLLNEQKNCF